MDSQEQIDKKINKLRHYLLSSYFLYKVCEGCDAMLLHEYNVCPMCNAYRFNTSKNAVIERIDKYMLTVDKELVQILG